MIALSGLLFAGSIGAELGAWNGLAALWMLAVLVAIYADFKGTPAESDLTIIREMPRVVCLEGVFERSIKLTYTPKKGALKRYPGVSAVELHEAIPASFEVLASFDAGEMADPDFVPRRLTDLEFAAGTLAGFSDFTLGASNLEVRGDQASKRSVQGVVEVWSEGEDELVIHARFVRSLRACRRGRFTLGVLAVHICGSLGLARRTVFFDGDGSLRVEPQMAGLTHALKLAASQREWDLGVARVRYARGGQTEFESLRDYVQGDEPRSIDWKAFARRGKPMVRQFEPERGQEVILLLDCGRRMAVPVVEPGLPEWTKLDHAFDAGLEFAAAVLSQGDRVGLLAFDSRVLAFVAPARSSRQLRRLKEAVFDLLPSARESNLATALDELNARHRRRVLVVVLSDLTDPLGVAGEARALAHAGKNRLVFCALSDPDLVTLATDEPTPGREFEAAAARHLATERQAGLTQMARGARVLDLEATRTAGPLLTAWFQERRAL